MNISRSASSCGWKRNRTTSSGDLAAPPGGGVRMPSGLTSKNSRATDGTQSGRLGFTAFLNCLRPPNCVPVCECDPQPIQQFLRTTYFQERFCSLHEFSRTLTRPTLSVSLREIRAVSLAAALPRCVYSVFHPWLNCIVSAKPPAPPRLCGRYTKDFSLHYPFSPPSNRKRLRHER